MLIGFNLTHFHPFLFWNTSFWRDTNGRETTDSDFAGQLIDSLPGSLWSIDPTDVGFCNVSPIVFQMKPGQVYVPQYSVKEAGLNF